MKITPETFVKITLIAVVGTAILRMVTAKVGVPGLSGLMGA